MQMIQAATAIANDGVMMKPYVIDKITNPNTGEIREGQKTRRKWTVQFQRNSKRSERNYLLRRLLAKKGRVRSLRLMAIRSVVKQVLQKFQIHGKVAI